MLRPFAVCLIGRHLHVVVAAVLAMTVQRSVRHTLSPASRSPHTGPLANTPADTDEPAPP
jgi:hypothetical protein